ncbi:MAG: S26 family signal peptidase [Pseudomonadota bacterium]
MTSTAKRRTIVFGAATLAFCGTLALSMTNEAPLILHPITPSLPPGLYIRTFEPPKVGMIAAFRVPEAAKRYKASIGEDVHDDFLFMKPIVAGLGDSVCNDVREGLFINDEPVHPAMMRNGLSEALPVWDECRLLLRNEFFAVSEHQRSFDSRHFGPIRLGQILGSYISLNNLVRETLMEGSP